MDRETGPARRRTKLIWLISSLYFIGAGYSLVFLFLVYSGLLPLNEQAQAYFQRMPPGENAMGAAIAVSNFSGALFLFFLRRTALYCFLTALALSTLQAVIFLPGWLKALGTPALGTLVPYGLSALVCLYVWKLARRGSLA